MLNLVKLCVGVDNPDELATWIAHRMEQRNASGKPLESIHTTRMTPRRAAELLNGGSLYWVMRGQICCRQQLIDVRSFIDNEGISRCDLVMKPELIRTNSMPKRPFQGWRYLRAEDSPTDLADDVSELPEAMREDLARLGLI